MPKRASPLSVGLQDDCIMVWAAVDLDSPTIERGFSVLRTGFTLTPELEVQLQYKRAKFLGTVFQQILDEQFVWHIYDLGIVGKTTSL